jgi:hypothetical protein
MGMIKEPDLVKRFCGAIYRDDALLSETRERLVRKWGAIDREAGPFPFVFTEYYEPEMGKELKKSFFSFETLVSPENAVGWKIETNDIEARYAGSDGSRRMNLDPGYLDLAKMVLLTTKDFYHRLYLGRGIYAEVTFHYEKGDFVFFPWTYPDYKTEEYLAFFREMREKYRKSCHSRGLSRA